VDRGAGRLELRRGIAEHDDGVADADFCVHDLAVGAAVALPLLSAEGLLHEGDQSAAPRTMKYGVTV
jgi:hypothetical protein